MKRHNGKLTDRIGGGGDVAAQIDFPMNREGGESKHMEWQIGAMDLKENREAVLTVLSVHRAVLARILSDGAWSDSERKLVHNCVCFALNEIENLSRTLESAEDSPGCLPASSRPEAAILPESRSSLTQPIR